MILLAYGLPGTGKSTLLHDLVSLHANGYRLFCNDHEQGWGPKAMHWRGKPPKRLEVIDNEDAMEKLEAKPVNEWPESGVWVFQRQEGARICSLALRVGDVTYVDDELDTFGLRKGWDESPLRAIVHQGRHLENDEGEINECHLMGACRRPQSLHTDITEMADQIYVFRVQGKRTLERLMQNATIEEDKWQEARTQPDFHFIHWPSGDSDAVHPVGTPREQLQAVPTSVKTKKKSRNVG